MEISSGLSTFSAQRLDPTQMRQQLFKKTDADGNGSITQQELTDAVASMPKPPGGGQALDTEEMFSKMDTDGNGEVTQTEHDAFLEEMDANRGNRPPPPSGGFEGSADALESLLTALQEETEGASDEEVSDLVAQLVEYLKGNSGNGTYSSSGSTDTGTTSSLFGTEA